MTVAWTVMLIALVTRSLIGAIVAHLLLAVLFGAFGLWFMARSVLFWLDRADRALDQRAGCDSRSGP
jgi:hypothetical protein